MPDSIGGSRYLGSLGRFWFGAGLGSEPELAGKGSFCSRKLAFSGVFCRLIFLDWPISALFSVRDWLRFEIALFCCGPTGERVSGGLRWSHLDYRVMQCLGPDRVRC
jgi:hypothetical protein